MTLSFLLLLLWLPTVWCYIRRSGLEPVCADVTCYNNGTLQQDTCTCDCVYGFTGLFCQTEIKRSAWPTGSFSLISTVFGCPEEDDHGWHRGYINMSVPVQNAEQKWKMPRTGELQHTADPHIMGPYGYHSLQLNFCTRMVAASAVDHDTSSADDDVSSANNTSSRHSVSGGWPVGTYCILKAGLFCPEAFSPGSVTLEDYSVSVSDIGGELPYEMVEHNRTVVLQYCCRNDGDQDNPVSLPDNYPFILLKVPEAGCQEVINMTVSEERFEFLARVNSTREGENDLLLRSDEYHMTLGLCYYKPAAVRECYFASDEGYSYIGTQNVSLSGKPCLNWLDINSDRYGITHRYAGNFEGNQCRIGDMEYFGSVPECYVGEKEVEKCPVPVCEENPDLDEFGAHKPVYAVEHLESKFPEFAVDNDLFTDSFRSARPCNKPWIQIDLEEFIEVHAVLVYRQKRWFPNMFRFASVHISKLQWDFVHYGAPQCEERRYPRIASAFRFTCYRPTVGQYVTIRNVDDTDPGYNYGYMFPLTIQEIKVIGKRTGCGRPLGMVSGEIRDFQISYSSDTADYMYDQGRLLLPGPGWCASADDDKPYFQIDLIVPMVVQGIEMQGWDDGNDRRLVKIFALEYGMDENNLTKYRENDNYEKLFALDTTQSSEMIHRFNFQHDIVARFLRVNILDFEVAPCLKMEVIGCPKRVTRNLKCSTSSVDYGLEVVNRRCYWIETPNERYYPDTLEDCIQTCDNENCLQTVYNCPSCVIMIPTRYDRQFSSQFVGRPDGSYSITRICIADTTNFEECQHFVNEPGLLVSPSNPFYYGPVTLCTWSIDFLDGTFVRVNVLHINLAAPDTQIGLLNAGISTVRVGDCTDHIYVGDTYIDAVSQQEYIDAVLLSTHTTLLISLHGCARYSRTNAEGFIFNITKSEFPGCSAADSRVVYCRAPAAFITSPGYPAAIQPADRRWIIEGQIGEYIILDFVDLDIWHDDENRSVLCSNNYVIVDDIALNGQKTEKGRFCSTSPSREKIQSSWHMMELTYLIEKSEGGTGFMAKYAVIDGVMKESDEIANECLYGWSFFNSKCYRIYKQIEGLTWLDAEALCGREGGHLVSMDTETETMFIHRLLTEDISNVINSTQNSQRALEDTDLNYYIGLKFLGYSGKYPDLIWADGTPVTFTSWFVGDRRNKQPDGGSSEGCTFLSLSSIHSIQNWHDVACSYNKINNYICETNIEDLRNVTAKAIEPTIKDTNLDFQDGLFNCSSGETISETYTCDGRRDCLDNSDEYCADGCGPDTFHCFDGSCISTSLLCNFRWDCDDGEDEKFCVHPDCAPSEWRCSNGQCVSMDQRCDAKTHCFDETDEIDCETCAPPAFQCYDQRCVPRSRVCDGQFDCYGKFHEDEDGCLAETLESCVDWYHASMKKDGVYSIHLNTSAAIRSECKFVENLDGSVTAETIVHHTRESPVRATTDSEGLNLAYQASESHILVLMSRSECKQLLQIDCSWFLEKVSWSGGIPHDPEKSFYNIDSNDDCSCPYVNRCDGEKCLCDNTIFDWHGLTLQDWKTDQGFITNQSYLPIFRLMVHDAGVEQKLRLTVGPLICEEDIPDEETQTNSYISETLPCRNGENTASGVRCLLTFDGYDEMIGCRDMSHLQSCENFTCPVNYVKCPDSYCISSELVCDEVSHCLWSEDEQKCDEYRQCKDQFRCHGSPVCIPLGHVCNDEIDCPEADDEFLCDLRCPDDCVCHALSAKCLNVSAVQGLYGNTNSSVGLRKLELSHNQLDQTRLSFLRFHYLTELLMSECGLTEVPTLLFAPLLNLLTLDLSFNKMKVLASNMFSGLNKLEHIFLIGNPLELIEKGAFIGLQNVREIDLSGSKLKLINPGMFAELRSVMLLNLSNNLIETVLDNSFQDLEKLDKMDLHGNRITSFQAGIFNYLDSLTTLYTDAFTFCCVRPETVTETNCYPQPNEFSSCEDLMRQDVLRAFLWIIGFLALIGNVSVLIIRLYFQRDSLVKTYGIFVTNLGIADLMMGSYLMILAIADTIFRGEYVWNDYNWRHGIACNIAGVLATLASEGSVIFLCWITFDRLLVIKFPFGRFRITRNKAIVACIGSWILLSCLALIPLMAQSYFESRFYSRSAVCLALPLTRDRPAGWEYSVGVFIVFNFVAILLIAFTQIAIYHEIYTSSSRITSNKRKQDMTIARNLFLIAFTNFMCLFPIGVMGIMGLKGHVISGDVYAWVAVFVLPINSALNPFIYTLGSTINRKSRSQSTMRKSLTTTIMSSASKQWKGDKTQSKIKQIFDSKMFFLGQHHLRKTTLEDVIQQRALQPREGLIIAAKIAKAIATLHRTDLVHGQICLRYILVAEKKQSISGVGLLSSPVFGDEELYFVKDVTDLGNILKAIIRNIEDSKNKNKT